MRVKEAKFTKTNQRKISDIRARARRAGPGSAFTDSNTRYTNFFHLVFCLLFHTFKLLLPVKYVVVILFKNIKKKKSTRLKFARWRKKQKKVKIKRGEYLSVYSNIY